LRHETTCDETSHMRVSIDDCSSALLTAFGMVVVVAAAVV
jgi:hypothetical protein